MCAAGMRQRTCECLPLEGRCTAGVLAALWRRRPHKRARPQAISTLEGDVVKPPPGYSIRRIKSDDVGNERARVMRRATFSSGLNSPGSLRVVTNAKLRDRYTMTEDIAGQGLTGVVPIVIDKATRQRRVLKSIRYEGKEDHDRDALLNEMDVYLKLDHPNICRLLEVYVEESACHLVMEMCTGKDLCERWEARGRYTEQDTREVVAQMLAALSYMHSQGIAHRDLKLENWVYADPSDDARLKLIDFGFSELVDPGAHMSAILGTIFYVAPEVFDRDYDLKCDMWSLGVITHMLLSGVPPFGKFTDDDETIFMKIINGGEVTMDGPVWMDISEEARDFVAQLLNRDPALRPGAQDAAAHPWLQRLDGPHDAAKEISVAVLESLRSFACMNVIKRTACGLIAASMSVYETDELEAQFKILDTHNRGTISMNELVEALKEHLGMSEEDARELFSRLDLARDGRINYSEFLAAAAQRRFLAEETFFRVAFDRFDTDHSGFISQENLEEVLGHSYMGLKPEEMISQINHDGDDVIRYEDFLKAMMDLGCTDHPKSLPGATEHIKNISRAFNIISPGHNSQAAATMQRTNSRRGSKSLNRGWNTPDAIDIALEEADDADPALADEFCFRFAISADHEIVQTRLGVPGSPSKVSPTSATRTTQETLEESRPSTRVPSLASSPTAPSASPTGHQEQESRSTTSSSSPKQCCYRRSCSEEWLSWQPRALSADSQHYYSDKE